MNADTTPTAGPPAEPAKSASPEEIERDIERTREQLGQTVNALAAKADVKTRAQQRATRLRQEQPQALYGGAAAALVLLTVIGVVVWKRRH